MADYFDVRNFSQTYSKNNFAHFPADRDETGDPRYYGLISHIGSWVIIEDTGATTTTGAYRYAVGKQDYSTNWTNRAGLTYKLLNEQYT